MRILSGIQPSGILHIGNYFGMMRPAIALQDEGEALYFIADYPRAHQPARSDRFTRKQPPSGARFPRLRIEPRKGGSFFTKRCAAGDRTGLDSFDRNASLATGARAFLQGQDRARCDCGRRLVHLSSC